MAIDIQLKQLGADGNPVTGGITYCGKDAIEWGSANARHAVPLKTNAGARAICVPLTPVVIGGPCPWDDDFSGDLSKWTSISRFSIIDGQLESEPGEDCTAVLNTLIPGDMDVQIDIAFEQGKQYTGISLRLENPSNTGRAADVQVEHSDVIYKAPSYSTIGIGPSPFPSPIVLRLKRIGTSITAYYSINGGTSWESLGTYTAAETADFTQLRLRIWSYIYDASLEATTYCDNLLFNDGCPE